jgi:amino acid permease
MFVGYSICIFSFTAHTSIFMVKTELTNDIERRIKKIFRRSIMWELILYLTTSYAGYFSFLSDTP